MYDFVYKFACYDFKMMLAGKEDSFSSVSVPKSHFGPGLGKLSHDSAHPGASGQVIGFFELCQLSWSIPANRTACTACRCSCAMLLDSREIRQTPTAWQEAACRPTFSSMLSCNRAHVSVSTCAVDVPMQPTRQLSNVASKVERQE